VREHRFFSGWQSSKLPEKPAGPLRRDGNIFPAVIQSGTYAPHSTAAAPRVRARRDGAFDPSGAPSSDLARGEAATRRRAMR